MSANRRCSTGWSAAGWRWSTTSRASPVTGAKALESLAIWTFTLVDTAGLEEAAPQSLAGRMLAQTKTAIAEADAILFVIDSRAGLLPADQGLCRAGAANPASPRSWSPTRARARPAPPARWKPMSSASASRSRYPPNTAKVCPICTMRCRASWILCNRLPGTGRRRRRTRGAPDPGRGGRPPECRQVDAGQPPARRGAPAHRTGGRHHPRHHICASRPGRGISFFFTTPPACGASRASRRRSRSSRSPMRSTPSASPMW